MKVILGPFLDYDHYSIFSSWLLNSFLIPARSLNYESYSRNFPCFYFIASPKFTPKATKIVLLCSDVSRVCFKENTGSLSSLIGLSIRFLIVVTNHETCDFCF